MKTLEHLYLAALVNLAILPSLFMYLDQIKKLVKSFAGLPGRLASGRVNRQAGGRK